MKILVALLLTVITVTGCACPPKDTQARTPAGSDSQDDRETEAFRSGMRDHRY